MTKVLISKKKQLEFENHTCLFDTLNNEGISNCVASRANALDLNISIAVHPPEFISCHVSSWMLFKLTLNCSKINLTTYLL